MNKRDAQQHLVAYKDNQREKEYALQHGVLSNFKAKYLEKIPLGNGKFRYIYEEAKDKVNSAAKSVANSVKNAVGTTTKINTRTTFSDPEANRDEYADKKAEDSAKRKLARQTIDSGATTNLSNGGPNEKDARMQFAKQAVAENQNKVDYLNKQKNAKPTGADRADKIESQRDNASGRAESKEAYEQWKRDYERAEEHKNKDFEQHLQSMARKQARNIEKDYPKGDDGKYNTKTNGNLAKSIDDAIGSYAFSLRDIGDRAADKNISKEEKEKAKVEYANTVADALLRSYTEKGISSWMDYGIFPNDKGEFKAVDNGYNADFTNELAKALNETVNNMWERDIKASKEYRQERYDNILKNR